jgi:hypothetical protein
MKVTGLTLLLCGVLFASCSTEQEISVFSITYDFSTKDNGWVGDFADYPEGDSLAYELFFKYDTLPSNLNANDTRHGLHISGKNYSDDLFMFIKKKVSGLQPNTTYEVLFNVKLASNAPTGSVGIGGSPGENVYLKAGASLIEPKKELDAGMYRMNIDKGNQAEGGTDMITIGHVGVAANTTQFTIITRYNNSSTGFIATTDAEGGMWLIIGTDSGYEGATTLYYTQIDVLINQL